MSLNERPPWLVTAASYAPIMTGAAISASRAFQAYQQLGPSINRTLQSNQAVNTNLATVQKEVASVFGAQGSKDSTANVLQRLANEGIDQLEFTDDIMRSIDDMGQASVTALYKFLGAPELGRSMEAITTDMAPLFHGKRVSELAQRIASTPKLRTLFFEKLAEEQTRAIPDTSVTAFNLKESMTGGVFGRTTRTETPFVTKASWPGGTSGKRLRQIQKQYVGKGNALKSINIVRRHEPGTVGKTGEGMGTTLYAQLKRHSNRSPINIPLAHNTYVKLGGERMPVQVYRAGAELQTAYIFSRFTTMNPKSKDILNMGEALFFGAKGTHFIDSPLATMLDTIKNNLDQGKDLVSQIVEKGVWTQGLEHPGFAMEAVIRSQMVTAQWFGGDEWRDRRFQDKAIQLSNVFEGIRAGASPEPTSKGVFFYPSEGFKKLDPQGRIFKLDYEQGMREFQSQFNPWSVIKDNVQGEYYGPLGSNIKPWKRYSSPMLSGLGQAIAEIDPYYHQYTAFVMPDTAEHQMLLRDIGDGGLAVRQKGSVIGGLTTHEYRAMFADELLASMPADDNLLNQLMYATEATTKDKLGIARAGFGKNYKRAARAAHRMLNKKLGLKIMGPTVSKPYQKKIIRASDAIGVPPDPFSELILSREGGIGELEKKGYRLHTPIDILPGAHLGIERTASGFADVSARTNVASHRITSMIPVTNRGVPMWKFGIEQIVEPHETEKYGVSMRTTNKPYSHRAFGYLSKKAGVEGGVEAITSAEYLKKNLLILRTQQLSELQRFAAAKGAYGASSFNKVVLADNVQSYMVQKGNHIASGRINDFQAQFIGMLHSAKKMGLTSSEIASIFAAETLVGTDILDLPAKSGGTVLASMFPGAQGERFLADLKTTKVVRGSVPIGVLTAAGELVGGRGSIEPRTIDVLLGQLPADVSGPIIGDLMNRLDSDKGTVALAREWGGSQKKFRKGLDVISLTSADEVQRFLDEGIFQDVRRAFKLPEWAVGTGKRILTLPTVSELAQLEPLISGGSGGRIDGPYQRAVRGLFRNITKLMKTSEQVPTGGSLAVQSLEIVEQEQTKILARVHQGRVRGKTSGAVYAVAQTMPLRNEMGRNHKIAPNTAYVTEAVFESNMKGLRRTGTDKKLLTSYQKRFYQNRAIGVTDFRHPMTAEFSAGVTWMQKMPDPWLPPNTDPTIQHIAYYPHQQNVVTRVDPKTGDVISKTLRDTSAWSAKVGDVDYDIVSISMAGDIKTSRAIERHLRDQAKDIRMAQAQHSVIRQELGTMWKGAASADEKRVRAEVFKKVGESTSSLAYVKAAGQLAGVTETGLVSNWMTMLKQVNLMYTPGKRPDKGILSLREGFGLIFQELEQAPISSKKSVYGESLATEINNTLHRIFSSSNEMLRKGQASARAGEEVIRYIFHDILTRMGMDPVLEEGGVKFLFQGASVQMELSKTNLKDFAQAIDNFTDAGGRKYLDAYTASSKTISNMSAPTREKINQVIAEASSILPRDIATGMINEGGLGLAESSLTSVNVGTKLKTLRQAISKRWLYISKPLLIGAAITAAAYHVLAGPGYSKEPLLMAGEQLDPRLLAAVRAGTIFNSTGPGGEFGMAGRYLNQAIDTAGRQFNMGELPESGHYNRASGGYTGNTFQPSARITMPNTARYNVNVRSSSESNGQYMAEQLQAHIPHARIGVSSMNNIQSLRTARYEDML